MPTVVLVLAFWALCAHECLAAPWFVFFIAPLATFVLGGIVAAMCWWQSKRLPDESGREVRTFIGTSLLWGPALGFAACFLLFTVANFFVVR
jgi:ABC-type Fe3+ transport system permease subunit